MIDRERIHRIVTDGGDGQLHKVVRGIPCNADGLDLPTQRTRSDTHSAGNRKHRACAGGRASCSEDICDFVVVEEENSQAGFSRVYRRIQPDQREVDSVELTQISRALLQSFLVGNRHC